MPLLGPLLPFYRQHHPTALTTRMRQSKPNPFSATAALHRARATYHSIGRSLTRLSTRLHRLSGSERKGALANYIGVLAAVNASAEDVVVSRRTCSLHCTSPPPQRSADAINVLAVCSALARSGLCLFVCLFVPLFVCLLAQVQLDGDDWFATDDALAAVGRAYAVRSVKARHSQAKPSTHRTGSAQMTE